MPFSLVVPLYPVNHPLGSSRVPWKVSFCFVSRVTVRISPTLMSISPSLHFVQLNLALYRTCSPIVLMRGCLPFFTSTKHQPVSKCQPSGFFLLLDYYRVGHSHRLEWHSGNISEVSVIEDKTAKSMPRYITAGSSCSVWKDKKGAGVGYWSL